MYLYNKDQIRAYYVGVAVGIEAGVSLDPDQYTHALHEAKIKALADLEKRELLAMRIFDETGSFTVPG